MEKQCPSCVYEKQKLICRVFTWTAKLRTIIKELQREWHNKFYADITKNSFVVEILSLTLPTPFFYVWRTFIALLKDILLMYISKAETMLGPCYFTPKLTISYASNFNIWIYSCGGTTIWSMKKLTMDRRMYYRASLSPAKIVLRQPEWVITKKIKKNYFTF